MKEVAILLLVAIMLNGCSSVHQNSAQVVASGGWEAQMFNGVSKSSGFSFVTNFTVNSDATLNIETFQFLTTGGCFASGDTESGTLTQTTGGNGVVTGPFTFVINSGTPAGNMLSLIGNEAGNTITGSWTFTGTGDCPSTTGTFTMTLTS